MKRIALVVAFGALTVSACAPDPFEERTDFDNPGHLRAFEHVPAHVEGHAAPVVVMLHGCTQNHDAAVDAGLVELADAHGFVVEAPEQQATNNPQLCFNWFLGDDVVRGSGEVASIRNVIDRAVARGVADPERVFVAGMSAGAMMAVSSLAAYPDVYAGGASFAGGPYGCAQSAADASACMLGTIEHTRAEWLDLARRAGAPSGAGVRVPRLFAMQGESDLVVNPKALDAIVAQWTALANVSATPTATSTHGAQHERDFGDALRAIAVAGMGHTLPVDTQRHCGTPGPFAVDTTFCAVDEAVRFFGLEP